VKRYIRICLALVALLLGLTLLSEYWPGKGLWVTLSSLSLLYIGASVMRSATRHHAIRP
jgi:hypothetical protein